jgi:hypothetical protein
MRKPGAFVSRDLAAGILPVICAVVVGHLGFAPHCDAQGMAPVALPSVQFSSGMAGLASGQTARLNVVNIGPTTSSPIPCVLVLAFVDSDGKILKQMVASVAPGKAAFLDLVASTSVWGARLEIRGVGYNPLLSPVATVPQPVSCNLVPTLELFDTGTGKTAAILAEFGTSTATPIATPTLTPAQLQ